MAEMRDIKCPICGHDVFEYLVMHVDNIQLKGYLYNYVPARPEEKPSCFICCKKCGLLLTFKSAHAVKEE